MIPVINVLFVRHRKLNTCKSPSQLTLLPGRPGGPGSPEAPGGP